MKLPQSLLIGAVLALISVRGAEPAPVIQTGKELIITDLNVVESRRFAAPGSGGPFTIEHLLAGISRDGTAKTALLDWLDAWVAAPAQPADPAAPREDPAPIPVGRRLIERWKRDDGVDPNLPDQDWKPKFQNAPFRLLAIVNRMDLQRRDVDLYPLNAGEGRFVFGVTYGPGALAAPAARTLNATVIFEYELTARDDAAARAWAESWHQLGQFAAFDDNYCRALAKITQRFTQKQVRPDRTNGSALNQIRTNELNLSGREFPGSRMDNQWILQEFRLDPNTKRLASVTTKQTPPDALDSAPLLAEYINAHEAELLVLGHVVPAKYGGQPFLGRQSTMPGSNSSRWNPLKADGTSLVLNPEARFNFAFNTCNGCHTSETQTHFSHIQVRDRGAVAGLSHFLDDTSDLDALTTVTDSTGHTFSRRMEIAERKRFMTFLLWPVPSGNLLMTISSPFESEGLRQFREFLAGRSNRVH